MFKCELLNGNEKGNLSPHYTTINLIEVVKKILLKNEGKAIVSKATHTYTHIHTYTHGHGTTLC